MAAKKKASKRKAAATKAQPAVTPGPAWGARPVAKIVQIHSVNGFLHALDSDGDIWKMVGLNGRWEKLRTPEVAK